LTDFTIDQNIRRFKRLLETTTDPDLRRTIETLLGEELQKQGATAAAGAPQNITAGPPP
jgi:hypothetical protein